MTVAYASSFAYSLLADRFVGYPSNTLINPLFCLARYLLLSFHWAPPVSGTLWKSPKMPGFDAESRTRTKTPRLTEVLGPRPQVPVRR